MVRSSAISSAYGSVASLMRPSRLATVSSSASMWARSCDQDAVVGELEPVRERLLQLRDLRPQLPFRELGEDDRVADAAEQRLQHRARRDRVGLRGNARKLDPGVLEQLLQPLDRARALLHLGAA